MLSSWLSTINILWNAFLNFKQTDPHIILIILIDSHLILIILSEALLLFLYMDMVAVFYVIL